MCQPVGSTGAPEGSPQVAIDPLGADTGEYVMISSDGLATRRLVGDDRSPARWIVIGIVDAIHASHDRTMGRSDNRTADRTDRRVP